MTAIGALANEATYAYDDAGRLTLEQVGNVRIEYSYDLNGNLLSQASCIADCYIDGACYANGDPNPMDACEVCDLSTPDAFTMLQDCAGGDVGVADMGSSDDVGAPMTDAGTGPGPGPDSGSPDTGPGNGGTVPNNEGGCSCRVASGGVDPWPLLLFGLLLAGRRRRRARWFPLAAMALAVLVPATAGASSVCKDGSCDYTTIGEALQNATANETIVLKSNGDTYNESGLSLGGNMTLTSTNPDSPSSVTIDGGGNDVVLVVGGGVMIEGVTIRNGRAQGAPGGGVQLGGGEAFFHKVVIEDNDAGLYPGGGIGGNVPTDVWVISSTIRNNRAFRNGGGIGGAIPRLFMIDTTVEGNAATGTQSQGGGFAALQSVLMYVEIKNSHFIANSATATDRGVGGGVYLGAGSARIVNTTFDGNVASGTTFGSQGGGLALETATDTRLENVTMTGNSATQGGGLYLEFGTPLVEIIGGDISSNSAVAFGDGGGIRCNGGEIVSFTGTVSNNTVDQVAGCGMCTVGASEACTTSLPGVCAAGSRTCGAIGFWGECVPTNLGTEIEEMCADGTDDDCDGTTDAADTDCQSARPTTVGQVKDPSGTIKDPVNTFTGEFYSEFKPDFALGGPMDMQFGRYYASGLDALGLSGVLGTNWRHSFEWEIFDGGTIVTVIGSDGRRISFEQDGSEWKLIGFTDVPYVLRQQASGWIMFDPRSRLYYRWDSLGVLTAIRQGHGNRPQRIVLTYNAGQQLIRADDELGRVLTFTYDASGLLTSVSDGTRTYGYLHTGSDLTEVIDAASNSSFFSYAAGGLLTSYVTAQGYTPFTQTFNASGRVATQTDSAGSTTTFAYNDAAGTCTMTDPTGTVTHTHDVRGRLEQIQWQGGDTWDMKYDGDGRRAETADSGGTAVTINHDPDSGLPVYAELPDGTSATYDLVDRLDRYTLHKDIGAIHYPDGTSAHFAYDSAGHVTEMMDRLGNTTSFTYDDRGRTLTSTNELSTTMTYTWVDAGLATATDPSGNVTTHSYDALGRRTMTTYADGTTKSWTYDERDHVTSITNENGVVRASTYDADGNLESVEDGEGNSKSLVWDTQGRLAAFTDALGLMSTVTYDARGDIVSETNREGGVTTFVRDVHGRIMQMSAPGTRTWTWTRQSNGWVDTVTDANGNATAYAYDAAGRTTLARTPSGAETTFTYDANGALSTITDPLGLVTTREYDAEGRPTRVEIPGGIAVTYTHDARGILTGVTDANASTWAFEYDTHGRLLRETDPLGNQISRTYDARNRVASVTWPGGLGTVTIARDNFGKITNQSYTGGMSISRGYDDRNLLTSADNLTIGYDANGMVVESNGVTHTRDAVGRIDTVTYAPGNVVTHTYNADGDLIEIDDWLGNTTTFTYDNAGHRTEVLRPNALTTTFAYDSDDYITGVEEASASGTVSRIALTRDARGNITSATREVPEAPALPANSAFTLDAASQVDAFTYDALGRRTSDDARTYSWDGASRLTSYTAGGQSVTFEHNGAFRLVSRTEGSTTQEYVWDYGTARPSVAATRINGVDERYYVRTESGDLLYGIDAATGAIRHFHFDEMGNTIFITDDTGTITHSYAYTAYGELTSSTGPDDNPFTFGGQFGVIRDPGSGLYVMGRRFYDSATKRFVSREPVPVYSHPGVVNPYAYAVGNPLRFIDPSGETPTPAGREDNGPRAIDLWLSAGKAAVNFAEAEVGDAIREHAGSTQMAQGINRLRPMRGGPNPDWVNTRLADNARLEARKARYEGAGKFVKLAKLGVDGQKEGVEALVEFCVTEGAENAAERFGRGVLSKTVAGGAVGGVFEAVKMNEDIGKIHSEQSDANFLNSNAFDAQLTCLSELPRSKIRPKDFYERTLRLADAGHQEQTQGAADNAVTRIAERAYSAFNKIVLGFFGF